MIIGITGMPTVGKDTFFKYFLEWVSNETESKVVLERISFADPIRNDLEGFIRKHYDIDVQTCYGSEKEVIRPLMIAHGYAKRQTEPNYWIDKTIPLIKNCIDNGRIPVFTDVRYINEIKLIQKSGGVMIHLTRPSEVKFPEADSDELIEGFEMCDLMFELKNINMNLTSYDISKAYISFHEKYFKQTLDFINIST